MYFNTASEQFINLKVANANKSKSAEVKTNCQIVKQFVVTLNL